MGRRFAGKTERWTIRLKPEIDNLLDKAAKERGLKKNDLVESIIVEWAYRHGYNKILHFNFRNSTITVWDALLNETVDLFYDVHKKILFCGRCRDSLCGHVYAAVKIPEVRRKLKSGQIQIDEI